MAAKKTTNATQKKKSDKKPAAKKKPEKKPAPKPEKKKKQKDELPEKNEGAPKIWDGPNGEKLCNIAYLSKSTETGINQLRKLEQQGVIEAEIKTKGKESAYNFAKCYKSLFLYYKEKANKNSSSDSKEMADEKLRQIAAKRELEEMKVKRARGELHHTEDIKRIFGAIFSRVHTGFESLPLGLAPKLVGLTNVMEIAKKIKEYLDKTLYEITNFDIDTLKSDVGNGYLDVLVAEDNTENDEQDS